MLADFSVASDLGRLLKQYVIEQKLSAPRLDRLLEREYPDGRMPITDWWQALEQLRDLTGLPHIGIELSRLTRPEFGGAVGYMMNTCSTVGEALQDFHRYQRIFYEGAESTIELAGDHVKLLWPLDYGYSTRESDDFLTAAIVNFLRQACGEQNLAPLAVGYVHNLPIDTSPYYDFFQCEVKFQTSHTYMVFPLAFATKPLLNADPTLHDILKQTVESQLRDMPETEVFLRFFYQHLLFAIQEGDPTVEAVAKRMNLSPRTLFRRLDQRRMHFKEVLMAMRRQLAEQYLSDGKIPLSEIAMLVGYSEQSAFSRAFKGWTGQTPLAFQKARR